jgi:hypothetical protein
MAMLNKQRITDMACEHVAYLTFYDIKAPMFSSLTDSQKRKGMGDINGLG